MTEDNTTLNDWLKWLHDDTTGDYEYVAGDEYYTLPLRLDEPIKRSTLQQILITLNIHKKATDKAIKLARAWLEDPRYSSFKEEQEAGR